MEFLQTAFQAIKNLFHPEALQQMLQDWDWVAYIVLFIIVFAETGLLVGFCLPGDSLLFIAGFVCSIETAAGRALNIWILMPILMIAAVTGDTVGYWLGRRTGPKIFCRDNTMTFSAALASDSGRVYRLFMWLNGLLFNRKHLIRTQKFYEKYGGRTIIYARFVPIVRTFAPFVAGIGKMHYGRFLQFNVWGGIGWIFSMMILGYFLGNIPIVKHNLEKAVIVVIAISFLPIVIELVRSRLHRGAEPPEEADCDPEITG